MHIEGHGGKTGRYDCKGGIEGWSLNRLSYNGWGTNERNKHMWETIGGVKDRGVHIYGVQIESEELDLVF